VVNNKRKQIYKANPTSKWSKSLQYYYEHKNCVLERYHNNPLPIIQRALDRYHSNPSPIKQKAFDKYHSNPSPIKHKVRERYNANPSPVKCYARDRYRANSAAINLNKRQVYAANRDRALARAKAYYKKNSFTITNKNLQAYYRNHEVNKEWQRVAYKASANRLLDRHHISRLVVRSIYKKYNKIREVLPGITTRHVSLLVKKTVNKNTLGAKK